jgi:hypothetical protein
MQVPSVAVFFRRLPRQCAAANVSSIARAISFGDRRLGSAIVLAMYVGALILRAQ